MQQAEKLSRILRVGALAILFGATSVASYAQSGTASSGSMSEKKPSSQMDSSGQSGTSGTMSAGSAGAGKTLSKSDQDMMREMANGNLAEIEAGKVAQSQASSDQVKTFAQKMIDDHTQAQKDLEQLAQAKGVTLPTQTDSKHMEEVKKLSGLKGDKFDKQYMQQGGLRDHREIHRLLSQVEQRATDPQLKSLAAKTLPVVDQHLTMAEEIRSGKSTASGASGTSGTSSTSPAKEPSSTATPSSGASSSSGGAGEYSK